MVKQRIIIAVIALGIIMWQLSDAWRNYYGKELPKPYVDAKEIGKKYTSKPKKKKRSIRPNE